MRRVFLTIWMMLKAKGVAQVEKACGGQEDLGWAPGRNTFGADLETGMCLGRMVDG